MAMKLSCVVGGLLLLGHVSVARAEQNSALSTRRIEAHPCVIGPGNSIKETLIVGTTVSRSLGDSGTCQTSGPAYYFDFYAFPAHAGQHLRITYATGFDLPLIGIQKTTELLPFSGRNLTREGRFDYTFFQNNPIGLGDVTYYLVLGGAAPGDYTLQISEVPPDTCSNTTTACLGTGSRFRVQAVWTASGTSGQALAIPMTTDTAYLWFFSSGNVEMVVKVLDARVINNKFWVFAGGLTNVDVTLTVTDTQTGTVMTYRNLANTAFQPIQDTAAFNGSAVRDVNIAGVWDVKFVYTNGKPDKILTFQLSQTGNSVSGTIYVTATGKSGTINGTISGARFDFAVVTADENCQFAGSATVNSTGDHMTGAAPELGTACVDAFIFSGNKR